MTINVGSMNATFSNSLVNYTALGLTITEEGSDASSNLFNFRVNGNTRFVTSKIGETRILSNLPKQSNTKILQINNDCQDLIVVVPDKVTLKSTTTQVQNVAYSKTYSEGYTLVYANSGVANIDVTKSSVFCLKSNTNTISQLIIYSPNNLLDTGNITYSFSVIVKDASIANAVWDSANVVWPINVGYPPAVTPGNVSVYTMFGMRGYGQFVNNTVWFSFSADNYLTIDTKQSPEGFFPFVQPENYWITIFDSEPPTYLGEAPSGIPAHELALNIDPRQSQRHVYLVGRTDEIRTLILKFDVNSGAILWQKETPLVDQDNNCDIRNFDLPVDSTGNVYTIYAGGFTSGDPPYKRAGLTKFDSNGTVLWQRAATSNVLVEPSEVLFLNQYVPYSPVGAVIGSNNEIYLPIWINQFGFDNKYNGFGFAKLDSNGVLLDSTVYQTASLLNVPGREGAYTPWFVTPTSPTAITSNNEVVHVRDFGLNMGYEDQYTAGIMIYKTNPSGTTLAWSKLINEGGLEYLATGVVTDSTGSIYISILIGLYAGGAVVKLDSNGNVIFSKNFDNAVMSIAVDDFDNLYVLDYLGNIYCLNSSGTLLWKNIFYPTGTKNLEPFRIAVSKFDVNLDPDNVDRNFITIAGRLWDSNDINYEEDIICKLPRDGSIPGAGSYTVSSINFVYETNTGGITSGSYSTTSFPSHIGSSGVGLVNYGPLFDDNNSPITNSDNTDTTVII